MTLVLFIAFLMIFCESSKPIDPNATTATKKLYSFLMNTSSSDAFIFGHHNTNFLGQNWRDNLGTLKKSDVAIATGGTFPGMYGFNLDCVARDKCDFTKHVSVMNAKGAVLHMFWQASNPVTNGSAQDITGSPITEILPGGSANAVWVKWMNRVAIFFKTVNVPAIFRPFHENTGGWFWWGSKASTPAQYIAAWKYTQNYLHGHGVHNILYAYAPSKPAQSWEKAYGSGSDSMYPGDNHVDITCFDHYGNDDFHEALLDDCERVTNYAQLPEHDKIPAICEFGVGKGIQNTNISNWFMSSFLNPVLNDVKCKKISFAYTWANFNPTFYWVPLKNETTFSGFKSFFESKNTLFAGDFSFF